MPSRPSKKWSVIGGFLSWVSMMVAAMIMGYMAYSQTFNGALLGSFLVLIVAPATLLGFIPVVGPALLYFWASCGRPLGA